MKAFVPKWIAWEITSRCNLQCIHCRSSSTMAAELPEFSRRDAFSLVDDITSYANPVLVLTGGEPLLHPHLFDIARYGTDKGLRMCLATNGTLITDEICHKLKDVSIKMVSLSLDGSREDIHDDFRQQSGAFRGTMSAIEKFRKHDIKFLINSSFTKRNQHDIANVYKLARKTGAVAWYMFLVVPTGRGKDILSELIDKEDYEDILKWHYEMEQEEDELLVRPTCAPQYYRICHQMAKEKGEKFARRSLTFSTGGGKGCVCGQSIAFISAEGNVQPCSYFRTVAGNIFEHSFKEIWENSSLFKDLRSFKDYKGKCGECEYISICGGCRARSDAYYNDYLMEEPFCDYIPVKRKQ